MRKQWLEHETVTAIYPDRVQVLADDEWELEGELSP